MNETNTNYGRSFKTLFNIRDQILVLNANTNLSDGRIESMVEALGFKVVKEILNDTLKDIKENNTNYENRKQ